MVGDPGNGGPVGRSVPRSGPGPVPKEEKLDEVLIVGIGHVFDLRSRITHLVKSFKPKVVALEIDPLRFHALRHPETQKGGPITFRLLRYLQRKIAASYATSPGHEMIDAAEAAGLVGADVAMIDMDARVLIVKLRKAMTVRRRVKLFFASLLGVFGFGKKKEVEAELKAFEEKPELFFEMLEKEYPEMKRILVDERNELMAKRIRFLARKYGRVIVFVGDAHVPGICDLLSDMEPDAIRLRKLMRMKVIKKEALSASVSVDVEAS